MGSLLSAMVFFSVGTMIAYPGIALPELLDENSDDLVLTEQQAALFCKIFNFSTCDIVYLSMYLLVCKYICLCLFLYTFITRNIIIMCSVKLYIITL